MVLRQIDLSLPPEAVLGLLGRTGSGKTTLIRLLARLYDPTQGVIRLEGKPLPELSLAGLRQGVGVVTQEIQLFDASLRDNLTLFDPSISDERILQALEMLGLGGWYRGLPQGLEAKIQPNSGAAGAAAGLSAGEAQLLAFVRVFLRDPGLVILDEASSRLDPATERRLEKAIDQLLRGRTAIIIAHRLDTVQRADTIMILDDGRQIEFGTREALIQDASSHYSRLLKTGLQEALV
jgi:ABC-type multidrug transport system fused ATPase/permease subunit